MESRIETYRYPTGEIQRVQVVQWESFENLKFLHPSYSPDSFSRLCRLYRDFIIKKYSALFGRIVIFRLPETGGMPFPLQHTELGNLFVPLSAVTLAFQKAISIKKGKLTFSDKMTEDYFHQLEASGDLFVAEGKRSKVSFLPVGKTMGFLSETEEAAALKVNGSFFVMDLLDCGTPFDHVGIPIGLAVADGIIQNPPQFSREALLVGKDGTVKVRKVELKELSVDIGGVLYRDGENAAFFERPARRQTPKGGTDLVVVENQLVAIHQGGSTPIPSGGFVIKVSGMVEEPTVKGVLYHGLEDVSFGIQVGNSVLVGEKETKGFLSPFYHFWNVFGVSFPPSMYPLDYKKARAPRIVLGADGEQRPMLLWFEGAGKFGYEKGKGSCGASLSECVAIAAKLGMVNGVHLDGGGSAQILLSGKRSLQISDRKAEDFSEVERAVPMGLFLR